MNYRQPIIDIEELQKNHLGAEDLLPSTVSEFLHYEGQMLEQIEKAHSEKNPETLSLKAHSLKGALASVCAPQVQNVAFKIETLAKENKIEKIRPRS